MPTPPLPDWPFPDDLCGLPDDVLRDGMARADALLAMAGEYDPKDGGARSGFAGDVRAKMLRFRDDCARELARRAATKAAELP